MALAAACFAGEGVDAVGATVTQGSAPPPGLRSAALYYATHRQDAHPALFDGVPDDVEAAADAIARRGHAALWEATRRPYGRVATDFDAAATAAADGVRAPPDIDDLVGAAAAHGDADARNLRRALAAAELSDVHQPGDYGFGCVDAGTVDPDREFYVSGAEGTNATSCGDGPGTLACATMAGAVTKARAYAHHNASAGVRLRTRINVAAGVYTIVQTLKLDFDVDLVSDSKRHRLEGKRSLGLADPVTGAELHGDGKVRIFHVLPSPTTGPGGLGQYLPRVSFSGFRMVQGHAADGSGGAVLVDFAAALVDRVSDMNLQFVNCSFEANDATTLAPGLAALAATRRHTRLATTSALVNATERAVAHNAWHAAVQALPMSHRVGGGAIAIALPGLKHTPGSLQKVEINNCDFTDNFGGNGGALSIVLNGTASASVIVIIDSTLMTRNTAEEGGAIYIGKDPRTYSALSDRGAAMAGNVTLINSGFSYNIAFKGGGGAMRMRFEEPPASTVLQGKGSSVISMLSTFSHNIATGENGGGVSIDMRAMQAMTSTTIITDSYFLDNDAGNTTAGGGGLALFAPLSPLTSVDLRHSLFVTYSHFGYNRVGTCASCSGGGMLLVNIAAALANVTIHDNSAGSYGGGVCMAPGSSSLLLSGKSYIGYNRAHYDGSQLYSASAGEMWFADAQIDMQGSEAEVTVVQASEVVGLFSTFRCPRGAQLTGGSPVLFDLVDPGVATEPGQSATEVQVATLRMGCLPCPEDLYSFQNAYLIAYTNFTVGKREDPPLECHACPIGAACLSGDRAFAFQGYWGTAVADHYVDLVNKSTDYAGTVSFERCPLGYCCIPSDPSTQDINDPSALWCNSAVSCATGREGPLCGKCKPGYVPSIGASWCVLEKNCNDSLGFYLASVLVGLCFAGAALVKSYQYSTMRRDGAIMAGIYFYQLLALVLQPTRLSAVGDSTILAGNGNLLWALLQVMSLRIDTEAGLCVDPGASPRQQVLLLLVPVFVVAAALIVVRVGEGTVRCAKRVMIGDDADVDALQFGLLDGGVKGDGDDGGGGDGAGKYPRGSTAEGTHLIAPTTGEMGGGGDPSVAATRLSIAASRASGAVEDEYVRATESDSDSNASGMAVGFTDENGGGTNGAGGGGGGVGKGARTRQASDDSELGGLVSDRARAPTMVDRLEAATVATVATLEAAKHLPPQEYVKLLERRLRGVDNTLADARVRIHELAHRLHLRERPGALDNFDVDSGIYLVLQAERGHFIVAVLMATMAAYTSMVTTIVDLVHCVTLSGADTQSRLFVAASVVCTDSTSWIIACIVLALLAVLPLWIMIMQRLMARRRHTRGAFSARAAVLYLEGPFRSRHKQWAAYHMLFRFTMAVASGFMRQHPLPRAYVLTLITLVYLCAHLAASPYHTPSVNSAQTTILAVLVGQAVLGLPAAAAADVAAPSAALLSASSSSVMTSQLFGAGGQVLWAQWVLAAVPLFVVVFSHSRARRRIRRLAHVCCAGVCFGRGSVCDVLGCSFCGFGALARGGGGGGGGGAGDAGGGGGGRGMDHEDTFDLGSNWSLEWLDEHAAGDARREDERAETGFSREDSTGSTTSGIGVNVHHRVHPRAAADAKSRRRTQQQRAAARARAAVAGTTSDRPPPMSASPSATARPMAVGGASPTPAARRSMGSRSGSAAGSASTTSTAHSMGTSRSGSNMGMGTRDMSSRSQSQVSLQMSEVGSAPSADGDRMGGRG